MAKRLPYGLRIHPKNRSLFFDLPEDHLAPQTLILHAESCRDCVGKEIVWPGHEQEAVDQAWDSAIWKRRVSFSAWAYQFLSFDLILREWLEHPPQVTEYERSTVAAFRLQHELLSECAVAAERDHNARILTMIAQSRQFLATWEAAIRLRWQEDGLAPQ